MKKGMEAIRELSHEELARFIIDMVHRTMVHHTLWFREVEHQLGLEKALNVMEEAYRRSYDIQLKRIAELLDFKVKEGLPEPILDMTNDKLLELVDSLGKNWLVGDGVWFQAVENSYGMNEAKRCNDSCWARFSPFEAWAVKQFLNMGDKPGLDGLKKALKFRMYASVNIQSIVDETPNSFIFQMNKCRVQAARMRKKLADYPCKSGGLVEYTRFAEGIDASIKTECIACPPDPHPEEWFCAWRFSIPEES